MLTLGEVAASDRAIVGGKALQLGRLAARGLPVPQAAVIPVGAFAQALEAAGLLELALSVQEDPGHPGGAELRRAIPSLPLPAPLLAELQRWGQRLGPRLAVRSSGVDEDGAQHSFAGQHATVLGVGAGELADAVRVCWASLYGEAALAYRQRLGRGPRPGGLAVLVQTLLDAEVSGVLFTVNPMSGSWREMTVEAVWGLGEGLVSGQVAPHWYLVRRPRKAPRPVARAMSRVRLQLVQRDVHPIERRWTVGPDGAVRPEPVPASLADRPTLDKRRLFRLCRLGLRVERHLGEPQDVEWAISRGRIYLLQARPVTAVAEPRARRDVLWTRRFLGERWPEPPSPLGWSLVSPILERFIAYPRVQERYLGGGPAVRLIHGRPYLNASVFPHLAFKLPGMPAPRFMLELMPPGEVATWRRRHAISPDWTVYGAILSDTVRGKRWRNFRWNPFTNHRAWDAFAEELELALPGLRRAPQSELDAVELVQEQLGWLGRYVGVHVCSLLFANLWDQALEGLLAVWLPERAAALGEGLSTCPPGNMTLACNQALHELAQELSQAEIDGLLGGMRPGGVAGERLDAFLEVYGARASMSWDIMSPRWAGEPERLVPLLRLARQAGAEAPAVAEERRQAAYREAMGEVQRRVPAGPRRMALQGVTYLTRRYMLLRENQRFAFDELQAAIQATLLWLGRALVEAGKLDDGADVVWLTWDELRGALEGSVEAEDIARVVSERRAARRGQGAVEPAVFLRGDEPVVDPRGGAVWEGGTRLEGAGISAGRIRGRVRIVRSLAEGHTLRAGEVLVARAVDPGWTPLFSTAAAVVLELGSRLSHGAVVAREYGIPGVVNIEGATRRLVDGQEVTVDGTRGLVWVHDVGAEALGA